MQKLLLVLTVIGLLPAFGKAVAWYRLDGFALGEKTTAETVITNLANPGVMDGKCYSVLSNNLNNATVTRGTDPDWMPRGTTGPGAGLWVYDPVSGTGSERLNAMHFGLETVPAGAQHGHGGMVYVADASEVGKLKHITVEVFFRFSEGLPAGWNSAPLVMMTGSSYSSEGFMLGMGWTGQMAIRYCSSASGNGSAQALGPQKYFPGANDVWHHAAFVYDETGTARLYVDYVEVAKNSVAGSTLKADWTNTRELAIGAHLQREGRTVPGDILEVRISDTALTADQFLQLRVPPRTMPDETVAYLPQSVAADRRFDSILRLNAATGANAVKVGRKSESTSPAVVVETADKPIAVSRIGINDASAPQFNVASTRFAVGTDGKGNGYTLATDPQLESGDFTIEGFFKTPGQIPAGTTWTLFRTPNVKIAIGTASGKEGKVMFRGFQAFKEYTSVVDVYNGKRVDDGQWHHLAAVYTVADHKMRLYIDYESANTGTATLATSGTFLPSVAWQNDGSGTQYFPGWLDEVRFVKKALGPDEFIIAEPAGLAGQLAQLTFEKGDFTVDPYAGSLNLAGTGVARAGGSVPTFGTDCLSPIKLEGTAGWTRRENAKCLSLDGGLVKVPVLPLLKGKTSFTAEWFMKLAACDVGTSILRINRGTDVYEGTDPNPLWRVYANGTSQIFLRAWAGANGEKNTPNWGTLATPIADGQWHHYAVTVDAATVSGKTVCRFYRDRQQVGSEQPFTGKLVADANDACGLTIGGDGNLTGFIDEVRFTDGVLPVQAFMRKSGGLFMVVR